MGNLDITVGVIDTLTDDDEIHYDEFKMSPRAELCEILKKLEEKYPKSHFFMNNDLTELQDDDILEDIYEDGNVFTAFRTGTNKERAQMIKNKSDAIVVLVDKKGRPMFIKSNTEEKYKWKLTDFDRIITVFRKKVVDVVDGQKKYLEREEEFVYTGRRFQIPQGKDVHKIKITEQGVVTVKKDGNTEDIPALSGDDVEIVEGVFKKSVGKKLGINFHNNTGDDLYVITGQKLFFEAHHLGNGEIKTIKIKPDWKTKHRFAIAPNSGVKVVNGDNREFSGEYFEVSNGGGGDVKIEKTDGNLTATLAGEPLTKLDSKVFKDKENFTTKEMISFVTTGIQIVIGGVLVTLGALNLAGGFTGGAGPPGSETTMPVESVDTGPRIGAAVREGVNPPNLC